MLKKGISKPSKPAPKEDQTSTTISNNLMKMKFMQKNDKLKQELKAEQPQPSVNYQNEFNIQEKDKWSLSGLMRKLSEKSNSKIYKLSEIVSQKELEDSDEEKHVYRKKF